MKKVILMFVVAATVFSAVNAYNPPVGSEKLFEYSSPSALSGNKSVTGGALFASGADSLIVNPALSAGDQRVNLNLGYTFLHDYESSDTLIGSAFHAGVLVPTKLFVYSWYLNGTFMPFPTMDMGNSITLKASAAKRVTDKLDVGLGLNTGVAWKDNATWALGLDLGFNYHQGDLWIFKDFRYGASLLNLGKNYSLKECLGADTGKNSTHFPNIATIKLGAAGTVFRNDMLDIGVSLDLTTALFQNLVVDFNTQFLFADMVVVGFGESINVREAAYDRWSAIPSISVGFRFSLDVKNSELLNKKGWGKSEMSVDTGYRNLYNSVNAYSVGVEVDLGMKDTTAPIIEFIEVEEE